MKNYSVYLACLVAVSFLLLTTTVQAAPPPPPPNNTNPINTVPVDGGILLLAVVGAGIGIKKVRDNFKK